MKFPKPYLNDLARFLPLLTGEQICHRYFGGNFGKMLRSLRKDAATGHITLSTELVRHRIESDLAIVSIKSGRAIPNANQIAYVASKRWSEVVSAQLVVRGTATLAAIYGGEVHPVATATISHECALAEVFLTKRQANPDFEWSLVHARPGMGALPDAITATGMIEVVGRYNGNSVAAKLELAATANLELW